MKRMSYNFGLNLLIVIILASANFSYAQEDSYDVIKKGNTLYKEKKYTDAEVNYRKSITTGKNLKEGNYNLGNAYFKQGKYEEAAKQYEAVGALKGLSKEEIAKIYHNLGNAFLKEQKYQESVQAYKNALKANPNDNDTRYNLAYAQAMIKKQEQQKNKDNKSDKNKQQQQQQQNKDNKDQQQKDQQQQQQDQAKKEKEDQQKAQQAKKDKISKEDAEKILQALNNDEKKTQKKISQKQPVKVSIEKQW